MNKKIIQRGSAEAGLTMVELLLVVAVGMVMTAVAIPTTRSLMASYQLDAAAQSTAGAIQSTRYKAIMNGYPFQVDFNSTTNNFQISSEVPPAATFSSVGGAVAISSSSVTLGVGTPNSSSAGHAIFQFNPNGTVSVTSGQAMPLALTIAYRGTTKHLTVSNYGSISVSTTTP